MADEHSILRADSTRLNDPARLAALRETALLDSPAEEAFDRLTRVAAAALGAPTAVVSLVDRDRQFLKSCVGITGPLATKRQMSLDYSFCQHVVDRAAPLVVSDASRHQLVPANLARLKLGIRAYLGVPLTTPSGQTLGSFCVMDVVPRAWTSAQVAIMTDLAASVMTEIELRAQRRELESSEHKFRMVAESARDAIIAADEHGEVTFWNKGAATIFGWTIEEMEGRPLSAIMPERYRAAHEAGITRLRTGGELRVVGRTVELHGLRKDGSEFPLELTLRSWESHGRTAVCGVLRDLTAARYTQDVEQALERQNEFLTAVLENVTEGIVACDADGTLTLFNRATRELHGLPQVPIPRSEWAEHYDLYREDGRTRLTLAEIPLVRALNGETVERSEMVIAPRGRPAHTVLASGRALRRADGTSLGAVVALHDVTAERRVSAERDRLIAILKGTPDFVGMTTPSGSVRYLNPAARRMLGVAPDARLDLLDARSMHPPHVLTSLFETAIPVAMRDGAWAGESVLLATEGRVVPVWQVIIPHLDETGGIEFLSTVMRDLSAAKAAEQDIRTAHEQAERASRAKSELLSRASHELRTPLNSVIGFSSVLLKNRMGRLGDDELAFADSIARNGRHLLGLVNELLDLSKIESGQVDIELAPVSLRALVGEVRENLVARAAEYGLHFTLIFPDPREADDALIITADEQRLRQVLLNIAGNAVKYTRTGGVVMRVVVADGTPSRIDVTDTGPGIAADQLLTIFDPFTVGDAVAQGEPATGLGLAIAQSVCSLLGLRLSVSSVVGEGTTFSLHLTPEPLRVSSPE